jgi:hypothetical protein
MSTKLNKLIANWPSGAIRAVSALKKEGYSQALLNKYRQSKWLTSVGDNAVYRTGDEISPLSALFALNEDLHINVHVGGRSALEFQGFAHYLRNERSELSFFGHKARIPKWVTEYKWKQKVHYRSTKLFPEDFVEGLNKKDEQGFHYVLSTPAQAMAEYLSLIPAAASVEEAKDIMAGLSTLRPERVQKLLEVCTSIKVKRLFLLLAEECNHAWTKKINIDSIDLGTGNRNLTPGGKLHKKYKITVPESILSGQGAI